MNRIDLWIARLAACAMFLATAAEAQTGDSGNYRLGPKDLVSVTVFEAEEFNTETRVSEQGTISIPLLGNVAATGRTANELASELKTQLEASYLTVASVSVSVKEFRSRPISVIGAVEEPGPLDYSGRWTLIEALTAAGGLTDAHGDMVYVLRTAANGLSDRAEIPVSDLMLRADPRVNIPVLSGDVINVPAAVDITVFCLGEVNQPGPAVFRSTERLTLLAAISRAGGLTDRAARDMVVKRRLPSGREEEILVNYKDIVRGRVPDFELKAGDVILVRESFF